LGLLNVDGYYDDLLRFMQRTVAEGFLSRSQHEVLRVGKDAEILLSELASLARPDEREDFSKV
jgi:predicted Rossmann-fold nucleotide-binding protein